MNEHVRPAEFRAIPAGRMGDLAPGFAALDAWTRPACLRKRRRMRELMPEPMRMAVGRGYYWRRADVEAFADALLSTDGAARPSIRPQD